MQTYGGHGLTLSVNSLNKIGTIFQTVKKIHEKLMLINERQRTQEQQEDSEGEKRFE